MYMNDLGRNTSSVSDGTTNHVFAYVLRIFIACLSGRFLIRKYLIIYKQPWRLPYICRPLKRDNVSLSSSRVGGLGTGMGAEPSSDATSTASAASWFPSSGPRGASPSEAAAATAREGGREEDSAGGRRAGLGRGPAGLRLPLSQVLPLPAGPGLPPEAPSW